MVRNKNDILQAALSYIERGLAVFPCKGKIPATPNGFKDATTDKAQAERWFTDGKYNIGIPTGLASGFWVLDLDGREGLVSFQKLQVENGMVPDVPFTTTGGGGQHFLFKVNGAEIRNTTKLNGQQIDVRGDGGYIIAPPSRHESGNEYRWGRSLDEACLVVAPEWLVDLVTRSPKPKPRPELGSSVPTSKSSLTFTVAASLAEAPGVPQGARHDTLMRLVGQELASGTPVEKAAELALGFAERCTPPMDQKEVLRLVSDLGRLRTRTVRLPLNEVEAIPLPESRWPIMDPAAYYGVIGDVVRALEPHSEADPAAVLVQILVMFGNVVGRRPHFMVEGTMHCCNLFCCVAGATSRGRKGTGGDRAKSLFQFIDTEWASDRVQSGLVSGEGLVFHARDPVLGPDKKTGQLVVMDPGEPDKRLLVFEPEFASVLRAAKRETNTLSPTLRAAWDGGTLRTLAKNSACKATGAHVSLIGHITIQELEKTLTEVEIFSGSGNRFLWLAARRSKLLPRGGGNLDLTPFAQRLALAYRQATLVERMWRDEDAERLWEELYFEFADSTATGLVAAITARGEAQTLRLSMIYALLDGSGTIRVEHLTAAAAVWRYCEQTARLLFGGSTGAILDDKVLAMIRQTPGLMRRDLHVGLSNNIDGGVLAAALARLRDAGLILVEKDSSTGGRPAERYSPANRRTNEQSPDSASNADEQNELGPPEAGNNSLIRFDRSSDDEVENGWEEGTV